jgi:hypothetical protein
VFIITRNKQILARVKFIAQPYTQEQNTQTQKRHHTSWIVSWRYTQKKLTPQVFITADL